MIYLLISGLLCLISELCRIEHYLLYVSPAMLFIFSDGWFKIILLKYCVTLAYDMIKFLVMKLIWYLYSALPLPPYLGNHLSETIKNYTLNLFSSSNQATGETKGGHFSPLIHSPFLLHLPLLLQANYNSSSKF